MHVSPIARGEPKLFQPHFEGVDPPSLGVPFIPEFKNDGLAILFGHGGTRGVENAFLCQRRDEGVIVRMRTTPHASISLVRTMQRIYDTSS